MRNLAICMKCGNRKKTPFQRCRVCGFLPSLKDDLVKSVYLSTRRYEAPEQQQSYLPELEQASRVLAAGGSVHFVSEELGRLNEEKRLFADPVRIVLLVLRAALMLVAVLLSLPWLLRALLE